MGGGGGGFLLCVSAFASTCGGIVRPICFAAFEIDDEFEFGRLLHRKIGGFGAFQDLVHISCRTPDQVVIARPVIHETAGFDIFWPGVCRRKPMPYREVHDLFSISIEDGVSQHKDRLSTPFGGGSEYSLNIFGVVDVQVAKIHLEGARGEYRLS